VVVVVETVTQDVIVYKPGMKFTPERYAQYIREPEFILDGFQEKHEYEAYWANTIAQWLIQSKSKTDKWKSTCRRALQQVEYMEDSSKVYTNIDEGIARTPIDLGFSQIQEQTALLTSNLARPVLVAQQESENQYCSAGNQLLEAELNMNNYDQIGADLLYLAQYFNVGYLKTGVDYSQYGPYGQKGKVYLDYVHPDEMFPDPKAKRFSWDCMDYIIQQHEMEIGDIRQLYPIEGFRLDDEAETAQYSSMMDKRSDDTILSPVPKLAKGPEWKRQKIKVYECWFKDSRLKFIPQTEPLTQIIDEFGQTKTEYKPFVLDDDGFLVGDWKPAYPAGRCIITAERVILEDMDNRLPHGSCPFIPVKFAPSENPYIAGDATRIMNVVDKMNNVLADIHSYGQREIQRPMLIELGCLQNKQLYKRLPNKAGKMIIVTQGSIARGALMRMPPVEIPQFAWMLLDRYQMMLDSVAGSSSMMKGVSDSTQLSAEAIDKLSSQSGASRRVAMKAKYFASAAKEAGRQMFWLMRRTYDEKVTVQTVLPDGSHASFDWESDKATFEAGDEEEILRIVSQEDHIIDIKMGTGTPDAKAARAQMAMGLYQNNAIDRIALLDANEYPDRAAINQRMAAQFKDRIASESAGKELGLRVKEAMRGDKPSAGSQHKFDT
jgi:hypothetical protein